MKIYLSRWVCLDVEENLCRAAKEAQQAAAAGNEIVVFPELFLTGYSRELEPKRARELFAGISAGRAETLFVFGSISEERHNRMTFWLGGGEVAAYDKVHLFRPNKEHEFWEVGSSYSVFDWKGLRIGMMNCNDLRFPEQARALRLEGHCEMLIAPAWWPWRRDHVWSTLLQTRAIENGVWVIGCCIAGSVFEGENFSGAGNHVFDPSGEPVRTADDHTYVLDLENPPVAVVDPVSEAVVIDRVKVFDGESPLNLISRKD